MTDTHAAAAIAATGVRASFGQTVALAGADLHVARGEIVAVMGPSGSGKSTLLHCVAGILRPDEGTIHVDDTDLLAQSDDDLARLRRRRFGFVFQFGQLIDELTAQDNVMLPLLLERTPRVEAADAARHQLDALDVGDLAANRPSEMSGGQAQRVAVARAMVVGPVIVFADEPTGALDSHASEVVMTYLTDAVRGTGTTLVLVTHDARTAAYADREVVVRDGRTTAAFDTPAGVR